MKKRILSMLLMFSIIASFITALPVTASAATSGACGDNLTWTLDDNGTLIISGSGKMTDWLSNLAVPWYKSSKSITSVIIDKGVTSIGDLAFTFCRSLTSLTISDSVTSIGHSAFSFCSSLKSVTIPNGVTSIGSDAFECCSSLKSVTIPNSVTIIDIRTFSNCVRLRSMTIPDGVTRIRSYAFSFCSSLKSVTIPDSVRDIDDGAFDSCGDLTDVYYTGSEKDWKSIKIYSENTDLLNATIHYNSTGSVKPASTEYATQHLAFAQSIEYNNLVNQRWGHIIGDGINTPLGNAGETMYNVLNTVGEIINAKGLSLFDNPYDPIVADLILQESGVSLNNFQLNYSNKLLSNVSKLETLCKMHSGDWQASSEYTLALESLIKEPANVEKSNPEFYQLCKEIFSSLDENELDDLLNTYGMASKIQGALSKYANVVNWVSECLKFNAMVEAYEQTDDDFKAMLFFAAEFINNFASDDVGTNAIYSSYFEDAVNKYANFLNGENTIELLFNEYFSNGMEKISSIFGGALEKRFISYISEGLGLFGSALTWAEAVKFGYNTGMTLGDAITNNGDIMDCRELIRATYFLENATYKLLDNFKYNLEQDTNDLTSKRFDAAYKLFQRTNIYSIKTYKKYLEKQQSSFCRGLFHGFNWNYNAAEIEIADILIAQWEKTKCHTSEVKVSLMSLNAQEGDAKTFKISGNQDVSITDSLGNDVFKVENGKITQGNDDDGISATVLDNMIVISDVNADEHTIKLSSTKDSKADISVQSFDATGNTLKSVLYKDVDINANKVIQCTYSTLSDNDDLVSDNEVIEPQYLSTNSQTVPIESIELSQSDITMNINELSTISVTVNPSNAVPTAFEWDSNNTKVATVDSYGNIFAKGSGSAKVYCTATDGSGISQCINITVRPITITINRFERSDDNMSLNYDISAANSVNNNIMIAVYDSDGIFCKLIQDAPLTGVIPLIDIDKEYNIKVLIWNLYDLIPLAPCASIKE